MNNIKRLLKHVEEGEYWGELGEDAARDLESLLTKEESKEIAMITAVIVQEDILGGSLFQTFDRAHEIAIEFVKQYPYDYDWSELEYDETIIEFAKTKMHND